MANRDDRVWGTPIGGLLNELSVAYMRGVGGAKAAERKLVKEIRRRLRGGPAVTKAEAARQAEETARARRAGAPGVIRGITIA